MSGSKVENWQLPVEMKVRGKNLLRDPENIPTDIAFKVGMEDGKTYRCHKFMLAFGSPISNAMFYGGLKESAPLIPVPDVSEAGFGNVLKYLYTEDMAGVTKENAVDVLYCAKKYQLEGLTVQCRRVIQDNLTVETAFGIFSQTCSWDESELNEMIVGTIFSDPEKAMSSSGFIEASRDALREFLGRSDMACDEMVLYKALFRWAKHRTDGSADSSDIRNVMGDLFFLIRFPCMTKDQLTDGPVKDDVLTTDEKNALKGRGRKAIRELFVHNPRTPRKKPFYIYLETWANVQYERHRDQLCVIEVREDLVPRTAGYFRRLCVEGRSFSIFYKGLSMELDRDDDDGDNDDDDHQECKVEQNDPTEMPPMENDVLARSYGSVWFGWSRWKRSPTLVLQGKKDKTGKDQVSSVFGKVIMGLVGFVDPGTDNDCNPLTWENFRVVKIRSDPPGPEVIVKCDERSGKYRNAKFCGEW